MTAAVVALLVVHNLVTNLWAADRWYVRASLATAGAVAVLGGPVCRSVTRGRWGRPPPGWWWSPSA